MVRLLLLSFIVLCGCERSETLQLATSATDFIELTVGNQRIILNARPVVSGSSYYRGGVESSLYIEFSTPDNSHTLYLDLTACNLEAGVEGVGMYGSKADATPTTCSTGTQGVTIGYTTFTMSDDPHCPQLEGVPVTYSGTITIESWSPHGRVSGSFETDSLGPDDHPLYGSFQTTLR
jgi:hypothetical protein